MSESVYKRKLSNNPDGIFIRNLFRLPESAISSLAKKKATHVICLPECMVKLIIMDLICNILINTMNST